ncbi:hypothetical protein VIGAN_07163700 [Vigna angularis var. angularis]|uniref:Uncharacterized protein n=1 Tax=Vigna angularis var. angularis TaxID=157739 RepID=A0A0S3SJ33_PHAAN|nr:hypothetical protein VIGAN_07163700 [Vigna angularis var. angularis]
MLQRQRRRSLICNLVEHEIIILYKATWSQNLPGSLCSTTLRNFFNHGLQTLAALITGEVPTALHQPIPFLTITQIEPSHCIQLVGLHSGFSLQALNVALSLLRLLWVSGVLGVLHNFP